MGIEGDAQILIPENPTVNFRPSQILVKSKRPAQGR
jgi:hypothetical protein